MLNISCCSVVRVMSRPNFWTSKLNVRCTGQNSNVNSELNRTQSQELTSKVLKLINEKDLFSICKYNITELRAQKIILHRDNNGPYNSLDQLLLVKGLNSKVLNKFVSSVQNNDKKDQKQYKTTKGCRIIPPVPNDLENTTNTILGIHIGPNDISWALLDHKKYKVLEWKCRTLEETAVTDIYNPVQQILEILKEIPTSDIYVMEELKLSKSQKNFKNIITFFQQKQNIITVASCLATRNMNTSQPNSIYTMRPQTSAQFFKLIIGSEVISTEYIVPKLLGNAEGPIETDIKLPLIHICDEIKDAYDNQRDSVEREQMNWSLLKVVTFLELAIKKSSNCYENK